MKPWKRILLVVIVLLTVLSLLLSACGPVEKSHGNSNNGKDKDQKQDNGHGKDKDKANGKEKEKDQTGNADKILICHKTGSAKHPYVQISVANDAAQEGHAQHAGDLIPMPADGCPAKYGIRRWKILWVIFLITFPYNFCTSPPCKL